jgi:ribosomal protein L39E
MSELRVVTMIDLEEIDYLSAAPGTGTGTSARKIRANKKNIAKALARGQSIPSWKRSLASLRGKKTRTRGWLDQKVI